MLMAGSEDSNETRPARRPRRIAGVVGGAMLVLAFAATSFIMPGDAAARGAPDSFADLAEKLLPSVVNIRTTSTVAQGQHPLEGFEVPPGLEEFFERFRDSLPQQRREATSLGSGFIISESGIIVTNHHVIKDAEEIVVVLHDDTELPAKVVGFDDKTDLAVLQVETDQKLPAVSFGDSDTARVGDWVIAIGNPLGFGGTVTAGIVSARGRDIRSGPYDNYIQTDASINRGNSGGPLFNMDGEVVGINTAIFSPNGGSIGIGFSVPSNLADRVVSQIREFGTTRRGWLGVTIQDVSDEIADSLGLEDASGALISSVHEKGPAADAGLKTGDVITSFNGNKVKDTRQLVRAVADAPVGGEVPVDIVRSGEKMTQVVTLGQREKAELAALQSVEEPKPELETSKLDSLGLTLAPLDDDLRKQFKFADDEGGVVILNVASGSDAAEKNLQPGAVITKVNQTSVSSPEEVEKIVKEAKEAGRKSVLLFVMYNGELSLFPIKIAG